MDHHLTKARFNKSRGTTPDLLHISGRERILRERAPKPTATAPALK